MKQKLWFVLVSILMLFGPLRFASAQAGQAKWTLMVYMAADNNLEPDSIINLMEMAAVGSTSDVNIVLQMTRPPDYKGFYGDWGGTRRFVITPSDGGVSSGDFQLSQTRFDDYVKSIADKAGWTPDQVTQTTRAARPDQEQLAMQMSVPTIETATPLTPLQLTDVQDMGASVNSGAGATLSDFGTWAVQNYPADHYGLIMWDHGGGWSMIASDDALNPAGMTMPDLGTALDTITQAANQKLDFIGFDACLMSQVAVAETIEPYADYEIGAEELVPGFGWDYTAPLKALVANPDLSVPDFAKDEIDAFDTLYGTTEKDAAGSYDLGVTDLSKTDDVVKALGDFDSAVKASSDDQLKAISTARGNAQEFGSLGESADTTDSISSVDLSDFMRLMSTLSKDPGVQTAAKSVIDAVKQMVLYHKASKTLPHANGLSIFFPADSGTYAEADGDRYRQEFSDSLPMWQDFLNTLYGDATSSAKGSKLDLHVTAVSTDQTAGSIYDTPVVSYSLDGKSVVDLTASVVYQIDANTNVVLDRFPVTSSVTASDGTQVNDYPDGQSDNDFYWNTRLPSLSDGTNSLLVLMDTNAKDQQHGFIQGTYTNQVTGKQATAWVLIDLDSYQSTGVWAAQDTSQTNHTLAEITPKPGDTFEPSYVVIDQSGNSQLVASGTTLTFGKDPFQVTDAPGPDGKYTVVLQATDASGRTAVDTATVNVANKGLDPSQQSFKDLGFGLNFLYPATWTDVEDYQRDDGLDDLYASDESGDITIDAIDYTDATSLDDMMSKAQTELNTIDGVQIGNTTDVTVGDQPGKSIAYTYTDDDGNPVDGTAVVVYVDDTQQGYLLELEAPDAQADDAANVLDGILSSAQFFAPEQ